MGTPQYFTVKRFASHETGLDARRSPWRRPRPRRWSGPGPPSSSCRGCVRIGVVYALRRVRSARTHTHPPQPRHLKRPQCRRCRRRRRRRNAAAVEAAAAVEERRWNSGAGRAVVEPAVEERRRKSCGGSRRAAPMLCSRGRSGSWRVASRAPFIVHAPYRPSHESTPSLAVPTRRVALRRRREHLSGGKRSSTTGRMCAGAMGVPRAGPAKPAGDENECGRVHAHDAHDAHDLRLVRARLAHALPAHASPVRQPPWR